MTTRRALIFAALASLFDRARSGRRREDRRARGDLLLPARLTDLREDQARRERARRGVQGKGPGREPRRHDAREQEDREVARLRQSRSRHPIGRRQGPLEAARPRGEDGGRAPGARQAARQIDAPARGAADASIQVSARYSCARRTTIDPSPTAEATRFIAPARTSPAANTPGTLVSRGSGSRRSFQVRG